MEMLILINQKQLVRGRRHSDDILGVEFNTLYNEDTVLESLSCCCSRLHFEVHGTLYQNSLATRSRSLVGPGINFVKISARFDSPFSWAILSEVRDPARANRPY
jgi:hypothetical protein